MDIDKAPDVFFQYGALGAFVVVLLFGIGYLFKTLLAANDARVNDLMSFKNAMENHTVAIRELSLALNNLVDRIDRMDRR